MRGELRHIALHGQQQAVGALRPLLHLQYGTKLCESESPQGRPVIPYDKIVQSPFKKEAQGDSSL